MSLFVRSEQRAMNNPWADWEAGGSSPGSACDPTALVPFFAAIRHIVDFMSTLPVDSNRVDGESRTPMASLPPLFRRLDEPGGIGIGNWVGQWAYGVAVHGNAVGWTTAVDGFGFPIGVHWLRRQDWSFDETTGVWNLYGVPIKSSARIVHSPWIVPPGCTLGLSPVDHFKEFWKAGLSAQEYADVKRGGGIPPTTLRNTVMQELDPKAARLIQSRAMKAFAAGGPFVSGKDWELSVQKVPPNQAQFLSTLALAANETAAIFGIDPREIGGSATESLTYATDESRALNRANNMRPYLVRFEHMVARLLPDKQFVKLNVDATIRTDIKTRTEVIGMKLADGRMSVNEARALEDEPPLPPGARGDYYNVPQPGVPRVVPSAP
jgi:HK97 family phage portal protein